MKTVMIAASACVLAWSDLALADAGQQQTRAQDYNSSRSNTTSSTGPAGDVNENRNEVAGSGTRAQDYNSSRSNNSSSTVEPDCANHNTTRSNRTAPALDADNDGDGIDNDCDSSPD
ncbi:hypothetical protein [Maricaulis sp.]|uniref:hypothetical protein n=1 Tax=Maricaulis sp. TaxID=1486257 RepID=UPI0026182FAC|nr:hypothetical protein [Maricaulis sp.]